MRQNARVRGDPLSSAASAPRAVVEEAAQIVGHRENPAVAILGCAQNRARDNRIVAVRACVTDENSRSTLQNVRRDSTELLHSSSGIELFGRGIRLRGCITAGERAQINHLSLTLSQAQQ
jgi:hypothetical protein